MRDRLQSQQCARSLKVLADPHRLKIIQCLQGGPRNVSDIAARLSAELANVSHHLQVLDDARLVCKTKQGKFVVYELNPEVFRSHGPGEAADVIDLGCCRLELTGEA